MSNLKPLVWSTDGDTPSAKSPLHHYDIIREYSCGEPCFVRYQRLEAGCAIKQATGFSSFDEAKEWAWKHYNEKMQPYVKPSPTKVFELTFDYGDGDGYFTVFMTTDKQTALDFIESVKAHDASFAKWHGINDDADEAIADRYNDTHPLKPYASKIFNPIYEDSFSEYANNYVGETFASQLNIIEHELFVKQGE